MKQLSLITVLFFVLSSSSNAQFSQQDRASIYRLSTADHKLMMENLDIESLRAGPSGDPNAPNGANTDESKVDPYELPELLRFKNGSLVSGVSQWEKRRIEIIEAFDTEIYGRFPAKIPEVKWELISEKDSIIGQYPVVIQKLIGVVDNSAYPEIEVNIAMSLTLPKAVTHKVAVILKLDW